MVDPEKNAIGNRELRGLSEGQAASGDAASDCGREGAAGSSPYDLQGGSLPEPDVKPASPLARLTALIVVPVILWAVIMKWVLHA
jgi:hypothetical protein